MLVLTRREGERICIGSDIVITIVKLKGTRVRVGIQAPENVSIVRDELEGEGRSLSEEDTGALSASRQ